MDLKIIKRTNELINNRAVFFDFIATSSARLHIKCCRASRKKNTSPFSEAWALRIRVEQKSRFWKFDTAVSVKDRKLKIQ